jgi:hypothetical protein
MRLNSSLLAGLTLGSVATLASRPPVDDDALLEDLRERVVQLQEGQAELRAQVSLLTEHLLADSAQADPAGEADAGLVSSAEPEPDPTRRAMTWTLRTTLGTNVVNVGADALTDAYAGDTPITESLPLLAVREGGLPMPAVVAGSESWNKWSGSVVALTSPIPGTELTSLERANELIRAELGEGWRMAEFHEAGGWNFWARGHLPAGQRFWVSIDDQNANPWATGITEVAPFQGSSTFPGC